MPHGRGAIAPAFADGRLQLLRQELALLDRVLHALRWSEPDAALKVVDTWAPKSPGDRRPRLCRRSRSITVVGALLAGLAKDDADDAASL